MALATSDITQLRDFIKSLLRSFDVTPVKGDAQCLLDLFTEASDSHSKNTVLYRNVNFLKYAYDYGNYNLYVFYYWDNLVTFIVDGGIGGFAVVSDTLWDQIYL